MVVVDSIGFQRGVPHRRPKEAWQEHNSFLALGWLIGESSMDYDNRHLESVHLVLVVTSHSVLASA